MVVTSGFKIHLSSKLRSLATTTIAKSWRSASYSSLATMVADESFESGIYLKDYVDYRRSMYIQITHKALHVDVVDTLVLPSQPMSQIYRKIGEKYGVEYSEEEIFHRYKRAYSQQCGKSRLKYGKDGRPFWKYIVSNFNGFDDSQYFEELYKCN